MKAITTLVVTMGLLIICVDTEPLKFVPSSFGIALSLIVIFSIVDVAPDRLRLGWLSGL
jgi:hypothetical protein